MIMSNLYTVEPFLRDKADRNFIPINGTFELLPMCNMDCKMCYIRLDKKEVDKKGGLRSANEWLDLAKDAKNAGLLFLQLTGGEVFLYKDFEYLYTELSKMGFIISINTNATLIKEENIKFLLKYPPRYMSITLYGGSNDTYAKLCNNPKGYDQVVKSIDLLIENNIPLKINSCITPFNNHDIDKIYKFVKDRNLEYEFTSYSFPAMRKDENIIGFNNRFSPEDSAKYNIEIKKLNKSKEEFDNYVKEYMNSLNSDLDSKKEHKMKCRAGSSSFWITWEGNMTPCGMMCTPSVNVFENGFNDSWDIIKNKVQEIVLCSECNGCEYKNVCDVCAAATLTETGRLDGKPIYICEKTKNLSNQLKRYNEIIS